MANFSFVAILIPDPYMLLKNMALKFSGDKEKYHITYPWMDLLSK